ncbi:MAG: glycosyltransferase family 2 protein [Lachnospiraceae bacterium]|nr:glycosyltransferase family 2 protein [Lachnospiraceae bacterium]
MTRVTVVIPNYNGIDYLENCLESVYNSSIPLHVIVVDNASKDGSINQVWDRFPKTEIILFDENRGFSAAVNAGIQAARTEYVLLLNNDTVVDAEMAERLTEELDRTPEAFSAAAKIFSLREPDKLDGAGDFYCALGWAFARGKGKSGELWQKPDRVFSSCAACALYRKSVFEQIGYFDVNHFAYLEDVDIGYRANIYGYANRYVPEAVVYHAGSAVSGSRHNEFKVKLSAGNSVYLIYKNMPFLQMLLNLPFLLIGYLCKVVFFAGKGLGGAYLEGISQGIELSASWKGRGNKVRFRWRNLKHYFWIQGQLWANLLRLLK